MEIVIRICILVTDQLERNEGGSQHENAEPNSPFEGVSELTENY